MSGDATRRFTRRLGLAMIALVLVPALVACGKTTQLKSGQCKPGNPLAGVYFPSRLTVKNACVTVTGIVDCVKHEPDGDFHIRVRLDAAYRRLLTPANAFQQCPNEKDPHLVVEIIPQVGRFPLSDNSADDGGFVTPAAPAAGDHITVTGPYVLDSNILHDLIYPGKNVKDWAEIHPAWNITVNRPLPKP